MTNKFFSRIRRHIIYKKCSKDPVELAKLLGVNFPRGGLHIYGNVVCNTEPWIITLGNNVHLTDNVRFITHDGGTLLFRDKVPTRF